MAKTKGRVRRGNGDGGIRQLPNGSYEGAFTVYRKDGTSTRKSFTRHTRNEILDIIAKLRALGLIDNNVSEIYIDRHTNEIKLLRKGQDKKSVSINSDILVSEYVDYYLYNYRRKGLKGRQIEPTTFSGYVDKCKYIKEYIGDIKVAELTFEDIEIFINKLHKRTCDTTARQTRDLLTSMMLYAKKDGITEENILQDNKVNLKECKGKKEKKIIQQEDIGAFVEYCKQQKYYDLLMIFFTGCRASELAGMTWNNLDFDKNTITIEKAYMRIDKIEYKEGKLQKVRTKDFKDLKSTSSYRVLGLPSEFIEILKQHKEEQKQLAQVNGKTFNETDWIFTTKTYKGYVADYTSDKFRKVMDTLKIKGYKDLTAHSLRHTFCSNGIMNGTNLKEMQMVLGHSNISVTANWYTHLDKQKVIEASNKVTANMSKYL